MSQFRTVSGGITGRTNVLAANASGISVFTNGGSANTKGAWFELTASLAYTVYALSIEMRAGSLSGATNSFLLDVGLGAPGSEVVVLENVLCSVHATDGNPYAVIDLPLGVPQGTRISARAQANNGLLHEIRALMHLPTLSRQSPIETPAAVTTTYGANTGDSGGVFVDPGPTTGVKSAWSEVGIAGGQGVRVLVVGIGSQQQANRAGEIGNYFVDIGMGAPGSEVVVVPDVPVLSPDGIGVLLPILSLPYPVSIPAGVRISARASSTINSVPGRQFDVIVYGAA